MRINKVIEDYNKIKSLNITILNDNEGLLIRRFESLNNAIKDESLMVAMLDLFYKLEENEELSEDKIMWEAIFIVDIVKRNGAIINVSLPKTDTSFVLRMCNEDYTKVLIEGDFLHYGKIDMYNE